MKKLILLLFLSIYVMVSRADEGMWLLSRLKQYNEARMKELGLKVPVDVIVDSLSQAIISFNGNGTASFISKDGLLVTNVRMREYSRVARTKIIISGMASGRVVEKMRFL